MARVYSKNSVKVTVEEKRIVDVKDVATALAEEIQAQNIKLSIDTSGLLVNFLIDCGYVPDWDKEEKPQLEIGDHVEVNIFSSHIKVGRIDRFEKGLGKYKISFDGGWCGFYYPSQLRVVNCIKEEKSQPKYKLNQEVNVNGWTRSARGIIVDIKWVFHNRLGEYVWGYKISFYKNHSPLAMDYIPEGYIYLESTIEREEK